MQDGLIYGNQSERYEELNADEVDALMGEIGRAKPKEAVAPKVPAGSPPPDS